MQRLILGLRPYGCAARCTATVLVLFLAMASAIAQQGLPAQAYPVYLLRYASLQKDLGIGPSVAAKMAKIQAESQAWYMAKLAPDPAHPNDAVRQPNFSDVQAHAQKVDNATLALLNAKQRARLREVGLQYGGAFSLGDPVVSRALNITEAEQQRLRAAQARVMKRYNAELAKTIKGGHLVQKNAPNPAVEMRKMTTAKFKLHQDMIVEAKKILSPGQVTLWKQMQGKPFPVETLMEPLRNRALNVGGPRRRITR